MDYRDIQKLKVFFFALKKSNYKPNLISSSIVMNGALTPIDKPRCLELLHSFPDLEGKNDNQIFEALSDPKKIKNILGQLALSSERNELTEVLEEKEVAAGQAGEQPSTEIGPAEQGVPAQGPVGEAAATMGMPGLPAAPSVSFGRQPVIHNVPPAPEPPEPKISVANKSGVIVKGPGAETLPSKSELVKTNSSGIVTEAGNPSKLVLARSDGSIIEPKPGPSKIAITDSHRTVAREHTIPTQGKFNFSAFRSKVGRGIAGAAKTGLETANPFLKRAGSGLLSGLDSIAKPGRMGGGRGGFGGIGRGGGGNGAIISKAKGRGGLIYAGGIIVFMLLIAGIAAFGPPIPGQDQPTAVAGPLSGSNISSCKFTRAGVADSYTSNLLLSYISEASNLSGIPPAVYAAFIRVENPSSTSKTDDEIKNYAATCPVSKTGALGIMQIQPPGTTSLRGDPASCDDCIDAGAKLVGKTVQNMTKADYCDPRTSIIVGSGFILKKMDKLGYKNTGKWDPAWTNDRKAIDALVNTYYGCLQYGGAAECTGPYNYGEDVYTGTQNCKQTTSPPVAPPTGNYTPGGGSGTISCPVNNGKVVYGSKEAGGHCSSSYGFVCQSGSGRDTAVDVEGPDRTAYLPYVQGNPVQWTVDESGTPIADFEGGGVAVAATSSVGGKSYRIRLVHIISTTLPKGQQFPSATLVGQYNSNANHVHVTLQEDGVYKPADLYFKLCSK